MSGRVYVCHTFYHIYVSLLKEYNRPENEQGNATIILSTMSNDFGDIDLRLRKNPLVKEVLFFDEKRDFELESVQKYKEFQKNPVKRIIYRIKYTKALGKGQEPFVPVDFKKYDEVYVYCDSDPIGYYLNYKHIYYHSLEDGLNSIVYVDEAHFDNKGGFKFKAFMAKLNLFFIQNGYAKYCKDIEVNQIEGVLYPPKNMIEVPRKNLESGLSERNKKEIIDVFVKDYDTLLEQMKAVEGKKCILILTEPLCSLDVRKQIFTDLTAQYQEEGLVVLKPHPRDEMDYSEDFSDYMIIDKTVPMEILNFFGEGFFDKAISVYTETAGIKFAKESVMLGNDFMDNYEAPEVHRKNETI